MEFVQGLNSFGNGRQGVNIWKILHIMNFLYLISNIHAEYWTSRSPSSPVKQKIFYNSTTIWWICPWHMTIDSTIYLLTYKHKLTCTRCHKTYRWKCISGGSEVKKKFHRRQDRKCVSYLHIKFQLLSKPEELYTIQNNTPYYSVRWPIYRNIC
jgi:hypothetical protein